MSDDLIKRSDAIEVIWGDDINPSEDGMVFEAQSHIDRDIRLIPSADRPQLDKDIVEPIGNGNVLMSEDTYEELLNRPQGKWIPCSERMPEEREWIGTEKFGTTISDEVLVTFESRGERFVKPINFQNGELGGMDKHTMDALYDEWKVVAWMPLPEPWKGADGE